MLGFLATFIQSRTTTEDSVLHAAATNIVYGMIEQIKNLDYTTMLPCGDVDPADPDNTVAPTVRVQINQNTLEWLKVTYTPAPTAPLGPSTATVGSSAKDNTIGPIALSSAVGARSQSITIHLWIWIDEIPNVAKDVTDVKKITFVYAYDFKSGSGVHTLRNREVILRTRYDK